jgi:hypothetical protein
MDLVIADTQSQFEPVRVEWDQHTGDLSSIQSSDHVIKIKRKPPPLAIVGSNVIRRTKNKDKDAKLVARINKAVSLFGAPHLVNVFDHNSPKTRKEANTLMKIMLAKAQLHLLEKR